MIPGSKIYISIDGRKLEATVEKFEILFGGTPEYHLAAKEIKSIEIAPVTLEVRQLAPIQGYTIYRGGPNGQYHKLETDEIDQMDALHYLTHALYPNLEEAQKRFAANMGHPPILPQGQNDANVASDDDGWLEMAKSWKENMAGKQIPDNSLNIPIDFAFPVECQHKEKVYQGLFESYKYCEKCNAKLE